MVNKRDEMPLNISENSTVFPAGHSVEIVERKGLGHPDTISDALAEAFSVALSKRYLESFGQVLHHNVDKVLLWGGRAQPRFGGGQVLEPIEIYLAGRAVADFKGIKIPVHELAQESAQQWLAQHLPDLQPQQNVHIHSLVRPGSQDLEALFARTQQRHAPLANDTSCGVGFAPLTPVENLVLHLEQWLQSSAVKQRFPALGADIKIMAVRHAESIRLTLGCAFIDQYIENIAAYRQLKAALSEAVLQTVRSYATQSIEVDINTADGATEDSLYLTVTGTSAEAGDDGEAGRGNRVNGLITPNRPMTLESVAGKNPITHVGKLYNVLASLIAADVQREIPEQESIECLLVSQIGQPIDTPQIVEIKTSAPLTGAHQRERIKEVTRQHLSTLPTLWRALLDGEIQLDRWPLR